MLYGQENNNIRTKSRDDYRQLELYPYGFIESIKFIIALKSSGFPSNTRVF
jgi:hypothetical protein